MNSPVVNWVQIILKVITIICFSYATTFETMCVIQVTLSIQESNYLFSNNLLKDLNNGRSEDIGL